MKKRMVEVFVAGCPLCDESVELVRGLLCPSCELHVLDMRTDKKAQAKAKRHGVRRVPSVLVDGKLAGCCRGGVDADTLRSVGVGTPA